MQLADIAKRLETVTGLMEEGAGGRASGGSKTEPPVAIS